jgi:hypothetical protein
MNPEKRFLLEIPRERGRTPYPKRRDFRETTLLESVEKASRLGPSAIGSP